MRLLDNLVSGVAKSMFQEVETRALPALLSRVLASTDLSSVGGLLQKLRQAGLDQQVASWLGNGTNLPISADQLRAALGNDQLRQIAETAGLPLDQLLGTLVQQLPAAVDQMSPNGTLNEEGAIGDSSGTLGDQAGVNDIKG